MNNGWNAVLTASVLYSKTITDKQKLLIAFINNLSNEHGYCFASNAYLGECVGCHEKTVGKMIADLEKMKAIGRVVKLNKKNEVEFRAIFLTTENLPPVSVPKSRLTINDERRNIPKIEQDPSPRTGGEPSPPTGGHNSISLFSNISSSINNTNTREKIFEERFNRFWEVYGYKKDREAARKAFKKIKNEDFELIIDAAEKYAATRNPNFVKHASTWLNGKCWEDEYEEKKEQHGDSVKLSPFELMIPGN